MHLLTNRFFVKRMLLTSKTIVQIQSKLEAIKACCVILSKETLIASVRVMNHVHSVTFLHRYIGVILFRVTERDETERNETKRNDFISCFSNYYRDITILRNETIPFRFVPFSF